MGHTFSQAAFWGRAARQVFWHLYLDEDPKEAFANTDLPKSLELRLHQRVTDDLGEVYSACQHVSEGFHSFFEDVSVMLVVLGLCCWRSLFGSTTVGGNPDRTKPAATCGR